MTLLLIYKDTILTEEQFMAHHDDTTLIFENLHPSNQHPFNDADGAIRGSFKMIMFTPSSELKSETL